MCPLAVSIHVPSTLRAPRSTNDRGACDLFRFPSEVQRPIKVTGATRTHTFTHTKDTCDERACTLTG